MKKYFIVVILGLFLGLLFARTVYAQENYFTPSQTMKELQEREENRINDEQVNNTEVAEVTQNQKSEEPAEDTAEGTQDYYYEQYTYEGYEDYEDNILITTKYAIYFQNAKYSDINFTLTYEQPLVLYHSVAVTAPSLVTFVTSMSRNISAVAETIDYCRLMGYAHEVEQSLIYLVSILYNQYSCIQDYALKCLEAYKKEDYAACIKYILAIENTYWELYIQMGTFGNGVDGTKQVSFTYTPFDKESEEIEQTKQNAWLEDTYNYGNKSF